MSEVRGADDKFLILVVKMVNYKMSVFSRLVSDLAEEPRPDSSRLCNCRHLAIRHFHKKDN